MTKPSRRRTRHAIALGVTAFAVLWTGQALADPCEAPVAGFRAGQAFAGTVRYVGDGDSICVGSAANPASWIEVRLADFYAPELREPGGEAARSAMIGMARGRSAQCTAVSGDHGRVVSYDRVIAVCRVGGVSLGDMMRRAAIREGGRGAVGGGR